MIAWFAALWPFTFVMIGLMNIDWNERGGL